MDKQRKIILGVTGSIAAYKAADIIRKLAEKGIDVSVIMTKAAEHFITPWTLSGLSGNRVYRGMFRSNETSGKIVHIDLAMAADLLLIAPATANIIGKIANGIADDLLTCVAMTVKAPILIAPAMNAQMYANSIVRDNCRKLKKHGVRFIEPVKGKLACGTTGKGHIADVADIVKAVLQTLK